MISFLLDKDFFQFYGSKFYISVTEIRKEQFSEVWFFTRLFTNENRNVFLAKITRNRFFVGPQTIFAGKKQQFETLFSTVL